MWVTVKKEITKEEKPSAVITFKEEKANAIMSSCERHSGTDSPSSCFAHNLNFAVFQYNPTSLSQTGTL